MAAHPLETGSLDETLAAQGADPGGDPSRTLRPGVEATLTWATSGQWGTAPDEAVWGTVARRTDVAGDLELGETLARGGMGWIRNAAQLSLGRDVAVKSARPDKAADARMLLREARITGGLEHPNIVPVHGLGWKEGDGPLLVMKRIEGTSWSELITDVSPEDEEAQDAYLARHVEILMDVCQAVHYAHSRGVVHRDIKPANVMVGAYGEVYLLDWGVALELSEPAPPGIAGTPSYMAPEMAVPGGEITPRTDVYLLGATLHHVLTDTPRHTGRDTRGVIANARRSRPIDYGEEVPAELAAICNKACAAAPEGRFPSAAALREALQEFLAHRGSVDVARRATWGLEVLRALIEDDDDTLEEGSRRLDIHSQFSVVRFGFDQALRTWSDNPMARDGLQRCLEQMIEYELELDNPAAAAPLLADLPVERPDLAERVRQAERRAREQAAASERLAAMLRDLRLHGHDWGRSAVTVTSGATTFLYLAVPGELYRRGLLHITPWGNFAYVAAGAVLETLGVLWFRRKLFDTRIYGRLMLVLLSMFPLLLFDRVVGLLAGLDFVQVLAMDIAVVAALNAAAAVTVTPVLWVSTALAMSIGFAGLAHPRWALDWFAAGYLANSVWLAWCFRPRIGAAREAGGGPAHRQPREGRGRLHRDAR